MSRATGREGGGLGWEPGRSSSGALPAPSAFSTALCLSPKQRRYLRAALRVALRWAGRGAAPGNKPCTPGWDETVRCVPDLPAVWQLLLLQVFSCGSVRVGQEPPRSRRGCRQNSANNKLSPYVEFRIRLAIMCAVGFFSLFCNPPHAFIKPAHIILRASVQSSALSSGSQGARGNSMAIIQPRCGVGR